MAPCISDITKALIWYNPDFSQVNCPDVLIWDTLRIPETARTSVKSINVVDNIAGFVVAHAVNMTEMVKITLAHVMKYYMYSERHCKWYTSYI